MAMKRRLTGWRRVLALMLVVHAVTACAITADMWGTGQDFEECGVLANAVLDAHHVPPAATTSGSRSRALYCGIYQRNPFITHLYTRLTVYEIVDRDEQDRVLATLRQARRPGYKPIIVRFFEKEVWNEGRGTEVLLRTEVLR
jgi:hypothetical protein